MIFLLFLSLSSGLSIFPFAPILVQASPDTETLWVDSDDNSKTGWTRTGTSPYLDAMGDNNYVYTSTQGALVGDFGFQNLSGSGTINSVYIKLYAKGLGSGTQIRVYIYDGSTWTDKGTFTVPYPNYGWISKDVSTELDTWTKIQNAELYFKLESFAGPPSNTYVDASKLEVDYAADTESPTWSNPQTNITASGYPCNFSVQLQDNIALSHYRFGTNNTGSWQNESWTSISGTSYTVTVVKTLNSTVGVRVEWQVWFNDTNNNHNTTGIRYLITTEVKPNPVEVVTEVYLNPDYSGTIGQPINFKVHWQDVVNLSGYIFGCNNSGSWINESWTAFSPEGKDVWSVTQPFDYTRMTNEGLNITVGVTIKFEVWANDTDRNWNTTGPHYITTTVPNVTQELMWIFSASVKRKLGGSNPPYVRKYNEETGWDYYAQPEDLLAGVHFYRFTDNQTYLDYAYEIANWLNNTSNDARDLFSDYYVTGSNFPSTQQITSKTVGQRLILLCNLVELNSSYLQLLKDVTDKAIEMFVPTNTCRVYNKVQRDGTIVSDKSFVGNIARFAAALAWAYNLTENDTYRNFAVRIIMNWTYGSYYIPYEGIEQNGDPYLVYWSIPSGRGDYVNQLLLAMNTIYYYTRNGTIKDYINRTAWYVAQAFYDTTDKHFVYRVNVNSGANLDGQSIHGEGITEEALFGASLIWGNTTWRTRLRESFDTLYIKNNVDQILERNLITHGSASQKDVTWGWNVYARRISFIMFSYYNHNQTYKQTSNKLYAASVVAHKKSKGYAAGIYADNITNYSSGADIYLSLSFRGFVNRTIDNFSNFDDYFYIFGEAFTGAAVYLNPRDLNLKIMDWDLTDSISGSYVYVDSDLKISDSNGWANWTDISGTVEVKIKYFGYWVNGSFSVTIDEDKTIDVRCKLYDAYFHVIDNDGNPVCGANVTAYNTTALVYQITSNSANSTGYAYLTNLPNFTSLPIAVYSGVNNRTLKANTTRNISSDEVVTSDITITVTRFSLATLYKVHLDLREDFYEGNNLVVVFYDYQNKQEANTTIWSVVPPERVNLSIDIQHPLNKGIENATLVLIDDSGNIITTVTSFLVSRSVVMQRISEIDAQWVNASSEERRALFRELVDIDAQWPYAQP